MIVLPRGLTIDPATGFGWAFGVLGALGALGTVATAWLRRAIVHSGRHDGTHLRTWRDHRFGDFLEPINHGQ
ncbi:hypothetical protein [Amycolatopsis sp. NBC_00438]|uniref:hypothetical protein n=1 Tax=Amycolatopsis sp. NBC_00438 TaxID=2903558 RepID=UPI002E214213